MQVAAWHVKEKMKSYKGLFNKESPRKDAKELFLGHNQPSSLHTRKSKKRWTRSFHEATVKPVI